MNDYSFRLMFIYDKETFVSCVVFMGDGTHVSPKSKLRIGVTEQFEKMVFEEQDLKYITLFKALETLNNLVIIENNIIKHVNEKTDFRVTASVPYEYKYDRLSKQVFNNVLKRNNMTDFQLLVGEVE